MKSNFFKISTFAATLAAATAVTGEAQAQNPGGSQPPYIMMILDTSGSTEWTDQGDERYAERLPGGTIPTQYGGSDPAGGEPNEWVPGTEMDIDPSIPSDGPEMFGPCMVWETDDCSKYRRPSFFYASGIPTKWDPADMSSPVNGSRFDKMLGDASAPSVGIRLQQESQPRHVTLKEVLTGQMVLAPKNYTGNLLGLNPETEGPGCWFVRRQQGASIQPANEQAYCTSNPNAWEKLPDYDEPRPHFQEVISGRKPGSGIIEKFSGQAIFAVAMLDGYKDATPPVDAWDDDINDTFPGEMPPSNVWPDYGPMGIVSSSRTSTNNEDYNGDGVDRYNLGLYRVVGPKDLEIPTSLLSQSADFVQAAVNDAGVVNKDNWDQVEIEGKSGFEWLNLNFDKDLNKYVGMKYKLGRQPIAKATPLAAAVADAHQFLGNDIRFQDEQTTGDNKSDRFARCRAKHVVLVTDGFPEPERPGGAGNDLGSVGLTPAFGFDDPNLYTYEVVENEIASLVGSDLIYPQTTDTELRHQFGPRVHIVSLDVQNDVTLRTNIAAKLSAMADAGNTCASALLPERRPGVCDPNTTWCLVEQPDGMWRPPYNDPNAAEEICHQPALMLTSNRPEDIEQALGAVISSILGEGRVQSRTKAAVTNNLDDATQPIGGQYRFYSGVDTRGTYWRGILNRQAMYCTSTGDIDFVEGDSDASAGIGTRSEQPLHTQIAEQVNCNPASGVCVTSPPTDNRRIFTTMPSADLYDYTVKAPVSGNSLSMPNADSIFFWQYDLAINASSDDEFGGHTLPGSVATPNAIVGSRIPFRSAELKDVMKAEALAGGYTWTNVDDTSFFDYWGYGPASDDKFGVLVDTYRGRIPPKNDPAEPRVLGGILNSNPTVVGPPNLDLPIESYRAFKSRYGDRPTMIYVATTDGLLHAIHTGELDNRIAVRDQRTDTGTTAEGTGIGKGAPQQREAWAYIPNFIHRSMSSTVFSQPYFLDGTPVVKDVRLCQATAGENQNTQACRAIATGTASLAPEQQWRTTMVVGAGLAGSGYLAMDITRTGGLRPGEVSASIDAPDPIVLWEFDREWEAQQIEAMYGTSLEPAVAPDSSADTKNDDLNCGNDSDPAFWQSAKLGQSISQPEIATLQVEYDGGAKVRQRPVAVFGGGLPISDIGGCGAAGSGQAIYVVDLQTGTLLRRFVGYTDPSDGKAYTFHRASVEGSTGEPVSLSGSPALFDSFTGAVATRGFIGDSRGRLYKMNFSSPDPLDWDVTLFFDPTTDTEFDSARGSLPLGPAGFKPAIARGPNKQLVVTYGLGEPGDVTSPNQAQAVITLEETSIAGPASIRWFTVFDEGEKMTGDPFIFNSVVYFPTYAVPNADICEPGTAKIWALDYYKDYGIEQGGAATKAPVGKWDAGILTGADYSVLVDGNNECPDGTIQACAKWFGPEDPTLIRGLTLTVGPTCNVRGDGTLGEDTSGLEGADAQPQLIAQTSGVSGGAAVDEGNTGGDAISRMVVDVNKPRSMTVPMSWSVIGN